MRLLKYREQLVHLPDFKLGMAGFYKMDAVHKFSGKVRPLTPWFPNLLLTNGLNNIASQANWLTYCRVGSNNTAPDVSDTSLYTQVAYTNTTVSNTTAARASAPYFGYRQTTYRFAQGDFSGDNLQEVGVGWGTTGSNTTAARASAPYFGYPMIVTGKR